MATPKISALQERDRAFHLHPFTHHTEMHASGTHIIREGDGCFSSIKTAAACSTGWPGCGA